LFKKETGLSVVTYVNAQRLQRVTEELRFTKKSVKKDRGRVWLSFIYALFHK
jgi:methylphosphotriester-DNA--protein-cysteine methyltransferase